MTNYTRGEAPVRIIRHIILFIVVLIVLSAIAIWLGLGPVVHSEAAKVGAGLFMKSRV